MINEVDLRQLWSDLDKYEKEVNQLKLNLYFLSF